MSAALREQIKIVFFDIDDTIYSRFEDRVADGIEWAFQSLKARGIIPAIATGRARYIFPGKLTAMLDRVGVEYLVTINGQFNWRGRDQVSAYPVDPAAVARMTDYFDAKGIAVGYAGADYMAVTRLTPALHRSLDPITLNYRVEPAFPRQNPVYQLIVFYGDEENRLVERSGILEDGRYKSVRWAPEGTDILDTQGSKIRGIHDVVTSLGLSLDNVMAFGDGLNDVEMLAQAGFGVAMGDGHPDLQRHADHVSGPAMTGGVYQSLLDLGLIEPRP
ncbi:MAG: HAD-IIB family hydrolase [Lautropia sp.]|nr:HAD-IIB family hydrolase [Lautropia sp.]